MSRSLPWSRRPRQATPRRLTDRAAGGSASSSASLSELFPVAQFQLVFPVLCHYGVELWVPEIGGAVDPDSEAHDLVMSLLGGLSKAERRRIQHRTRAAVLALATQGRWLGGRPNYGYRLVDTTLAHPNRAKAFSGRAPKDSRARPRDRACRAQDLRALRRRGRLPLDRTKTGSRLHPEPR